MSFVIHAAATSGRIFAFYPSLTWVMLLAVQFCLCNNEHIQRTRNVKWHWIEETLSDTPPEEGKTETRALEALAPFHPCPTIGFQVLWGQVRHCVCGGGGGLTIKKLVPAQG